MVTTWTLRARDVSRVAGAVVMDWHGELVERHNLPDTFTVSGRWADLQVIADPGAGVTLDDDSGRRFSGPLTSIIRSGDGSCTLVFESDLIWLWGRLIYPDPTSVITPTQSIGYDVRSGPAETVALGFINANAGPGAIASRRVGGLTVPASLGRGGTTAPVRGRLDFLGKLVQDIGEAAALRFNVVQVGTSLAVQVAAVPDLTATAKYGTWDTGGAGLLDEGWRWQVDRPAATRVIVGGGGVAAQRDFSEIPDETAEALWGGRIEGFHDASNEFGQTQNAYESYRDKVKDLAAAISKASNAAKALHAARRRKSMTAETRANHTTTTTIDNDNNAAQDVTDATQDLADANADVITATQDRDDALDEYNTARAEYLQAMDDAGAEDLADATTPVQITAPVLDSPDLRLGVDVPLGALVSLDLAGSLVTDRLRQITTTISASSGEPTTSVTGTVGSPDAGITRAQRDFLKTKRQLRKVVTR